MDVYSADGLGVVERVVFLFVCDLAEGAFLRMLILEVVRVSDFVSGCGAMIN